MSRIAALVTDLPADHATAHVAAMVNGMAHEAFYARGFYSAPDLGIYIGWVDHRGEGAHEPVVQSHGNKTLVFVGEHFGDRVGSPDQPRYGVDGAALISAYEQRGDDAFRELNGWFAGCLLDRDRGHTVIFNDRFGLHRVHHAEAAGGIAFASEAKAILAIRPESRRLDPIALGEFFALGCVFSDRTLFEDIGRMPGGSAWTVHPRANVRRHRYFTAGELEALPAMSDDDFYDELTRALARVVPKYFAGADAAAVSLTGGFDSRAVVAFDGDGPKTRLAYTYNGIYRECADVQVARRVAGAAGYRHDVLSLDSRFLRDFGELAEKTVWVTDGTLDLTAAHEVYLSRLARAIAPVRVTGNYGGEVFRGVTTFKPAGLPRDLFAPELLPSIDRALQAFAATKQRHPVSFASFDEIPSNLYGRLAAAQSQLTVRTPYTDNSLVALAYRLRRPATSATAGWTRVLKERNPLLAAIPTDRGKLGTRSYIRSRAERLYGYALFKAEWYYDAGMPLWLSGIDRQVARRGLPLFFVGSHKIQHYRRWFRDELADYLEPLLREGSSRSYLNTQRCRTLVAEHRSGARNNVAQISALATIELVNRQLLERRYPPVGVARPVEATVL